MTNLIGKWKLTEMMDFNCEKECFEWTKVEDLLSRDDVDKDTRLMAKLQMVFTEDGVLTMLTSIPEGASREEVDAAVESGEITLKDGMIFMGENHWKAENGKYMVDSNAGREVDGEEVDPWEEIQVIDDQIIELRMFRLKKAE